MDEKKPTKAEWQALYAAMVEIKSKAPWTFMEEDAVFGIQSPETGETGFVSVMGTLGEHIAVAVYLGEESLYKFWAVHEELADPVLILETPQLQASLEDREMVEKEDRAVMKQLGLKFRGRQAWPLFRSYRPGFLPWFLNGAEARFLTHVLQQTISIAGRLEENETLLDPDTETSYLVRVPEEQADGSLRWRDETREVPPPEPGEIELFVDKRVVNQLHQKKIADLEIEVDFFLSPAHVQEDKNQRPSFTYMLLGIDHDSGFIYGFDMMRVETTFDEMLTNIPQAFSELLNKLPALPTKVHVQSGRTYQYISPICADLDIQLQPAPFLTHMEEAKMSLFNFLDR